MSLTRPSLVDFIKSGENEAFRSFSPHDLRTATGGSDLGYNGNAAARITGKLVRSTVTSAMGNPAFGLAARLLAAQTTRERPRASCLVVQRLDPLFQAELGVPWDSE